MYLPGLTVNREPKSIAPESKHVPPITHMKP